MGDDQRGGKAIGIPRDAHSKHTRLDNYFKTPFFFCFFVFLSFPKSARRNSGPGANLRVCLRAEARGESSRKKNGIKRLSTARAQFIICINVN